MEKRDLLIKKEDIKTMKKDIARYEKKGEQKPLSVSVPQKVKKEEKEKKEDKKFKKEKIRRAEPLYSAVPTGKQKFSPNLDSSVSPKLQTPHFPKTSQPPQSSQTPQTSQTPPILPISRPSPVSQISPAPPKPQISRPSPVSQIPPAPPKPKISLTPPTSQKYKEKSLSEEKEELVKEKNEIDRKIRELSIEKNPFEQKKAVILKEIGTIEINFNFISKKEKKIKEQIKIIEKNEATTETTKDKRLIEQKRWQIEEKRREIERQKWPWEEKLEIAKNKIQNIEEGCAKIDLMEKELEKKQEEILKKEKNIKLKEEKINLEKKIGELDKLKKDLETKKSGFDQELNKFDKKLEEVISRENEIEKNKELIEEKEELTENFKERRKLEKERWEIEEKRRKVESEKWQIEDERDRIKIWGKRIEVKIQDFLQKENNLKEKIKEIEKVSAAPPISPTFPKSQISPTPPVFPTLPKHPTPSVLPAPPTPPTPPTPPAPPTDHRIEEAKKRIEALKRERNISKPPKTFENIKPIIPKPAESVAFEPFSKFQKPPEKPKPFAVKPKLKGKLWVRILIFSLVLALLAVVATFWYWYLVIKKQPLQAPEYKEEEQSKETRQFPEVDVSSALFSVNSAIILQISSTPEVRYSLIKAIQEPQDINKFKQLIIENLKENKTLNLIEFFESLNINLSEKFYQKTKSEFTLFIYSQIGGKRIGFVVEIDERNDEKDELINLLRARETAMKNDFNPLLSLMPIGDSPIVSYFRDASRVKGYSGRDFRYQTFSQKDLGICYLVSDKYFIFTTSWKSMVSVIEKLGI